jgi:Ribbon-helix-helix protein, copG family
MTDDLKAEMDWEHAEVAEGKPHGVAISVRLDAAEADRLRSLAASLHLNMSQVLRRALAEYDPNPSSSGRPSLHRPFTLGGASWTGVVCLIEAGESKSWDRSESATIDVRLRERVIT